MTASMILDHALAILRGLGASLTLATVFYVAGVAAIPASWDRKSDRFGFPMAAGAALFVFVGWLSILLRIPLKQAILIFAGLVLAAGICRFRRVAAAVGRSVSDRSSLAWLVVFVLVYVLAYAFATPPISSGFLPLAWRGNIDIFQYLSFTAYLQRLGPSNIAGFSYLNYTYFQTPGVFSLLGLFAMFFGTDVMRATMPALFACIGLLGVLVARVSRSVFGTSYAASAGIACVVVSGPFFRYLSTNYFLSTLMAAPVLLHLLWTTCAAENDEPSPRAPVVGRYFAHYLLLLYLYQMFFFLGIAVQAGFSVIRAIAATQDSVAPGTRPIPWFRRVIRSVRAITAGAGLVAICAPDHVFWAHAGALRTLAGGYRWVAA